MRTAVGSHSMRNKEISSEMFSVEYGRVGEVEIDVTDDKSTSRGRT